MSIFANTSIRTKFLISPVLLIILIMILIPFVTRNVNQQYKTISEYNKAGMLSSHELFILLKEIQLNHYKLESFIKDYQHEPQGSFDWAPIKKRFKTQAANHVFNFLDLSHKYELQNKHKSFVNIIHSNLIQYQKLLNAKLDSLSSDSTSNISHLQTLMEQLHADFRDLIANLEIETSLSIQNIQRVSQTHLNYFLVYIWVAALLTIIVGVFFSGFLSKPIQKLSSTISDITRSGDYTQRAPSTNQFEVNKLINGFNQMLFEIGRSELELKEARERYLSVFNSLSLMLIVTNEKGLIVDINSKAMRVLGYSAKKDIHHKYISHILHKGSQENPNSIAFEDLAAKEMARFTKRSLVDRHGDVVKVMFSSSIMMNKIGKTQGVICLAYPIS